MSDEQAPGGGFETAPERRAWDAWQEALRQAPAELQTGSAQTGNPPRTTWGAEEANLLRASLLRRDLACVLIGFPAIGQEEFHRSLREHRLLTMGYWESFDGKFNCAIVLVPGNIPAYKAFVELVKAQWAIQLKAPKY